MNANLDYKTDLKANVVVGINEQPEDDARGFM